MDMNQLEPGTLLMHCRSQNFCILWKKGRTPDDQLCVRYWIRDFNFLASPMDVPADQMVYIGDLREFGIDEERL